jgi:prevent-host-death family protein
MLVKGRREASIGHMKPTIKKADLPKGVKRWMLRESQAAYNEPVEISVRMAKDQLSSLLDRAANGEDIVITSDGKPKAMIVRYRPVIVGKPARSTAVLRSGMPMTPDSTPMIRAERDSGY